MKVNFIHLSDARGKIGGAVASKNKYGNYFRKKVKPSNPQSVAQVESRMVLKTFAKDWKALSQSNRNSWIDQAQNINRKNSLGNNYKMTGLQLYISTNKVNQLVGGSPISIAQAPVPTSNLTDLTLTLGGTPKALTVTSTSVLATNEILIIEATRPLSAGKAFVKSEFRQLTTDHTTGAVSKDITSAYVAKFGALPATNEVAYVRAYIINSTAPALGYKIKSNGVFGS
jgi:hypothetical protein